MSENDPIPTDPPIKTMLDARIPQPGHYDEYRVPPVLHCALDVLYEERKTCSDTAVSVVDNAILRLVLPWIRFDPPPQD
jgi:hypothetical protein